MATYQNLPEVTLPVAADYSSTGQFRFMTLTGSKTAQLATTRGEKCTGVLQNDPAAANRAGNVRIAGTSKIIYGGTVDEDDPLTTDSTGRAIRADRATDYIMGHAEVAGVVSDVGEIRLNRIGRNERDDPRVIYEDFSGYAATDQVANVQPDGTAADGSTGVLNHCYTPGGLVLGYAALGTGQTITGPVITATGLNIAGDQTADEGYEIFSHWLGASGRPFVIGQAPAFYFKCKINVGDVSGIDDLQIGFRRCEIVNAAWDDYLDAAAIGWITAANPAAVQTQTILNNGATSETDTTDTLADATDAEFAIFVSAAGVVSFKHDLAAAGTLAAPTAAGTYTFDDGDPVMPFMRFLNDTALGDTVNILKWEVGYQASL